MRQQKGLSHVLRSISEVVEKEIGAARRFGLKSKGLLRRSLELWHERRAGPVVADFEKRARGVVLELTWHPRGRVLSDIDNQRLLDGLGRWHDGGSLARFLSEPTNNRAERALRPAVIARKVSQCTKSAGGTDAFEARTGVLVTLGRTASGVGLLDAVVALVRPVHPRPAWVAIGCANQLHIHNFFWI